MGEGKGPRGQRDKVIRGHAVAMARGGGGGGGGGGGTRPRARCSALHACTLALLLTGRARARNNHGDADADPSGPWLPDVFLLGEQKALSTSLYAGMARHPLICQAAKEPHCFDKREMMPPAKYRGIYSGCRPDQVTVDATPNYLQASATPLPHNAMKRIWAVHERRRRPGAAAPKFIVVIREPVARLLSWCVAVAVAIADCWPRPSQHPPPPRALPGSRHCPRV